MATGEGMQNGQVESIVLSVMAPSLIEVAGTLTALDPLREWFP